MQRPGKETYATTGQNYKCTGCAHAYKISMIINGIHTNDTLYEPQTLLLTTEPVPASYIQSLVRAKITAMLV